MDFIFKHTSKLRKDILAQGDVVEKTTEVKETVGQAHQYYADSLSYTHFVVITQSCDLVRRQNKFKAPYITIAAAKPLKNTIDEFLSEKAKAIDNSSFRYYPLSARPKARELIERLLNNTEPDFFFLPQSGHENIKEDLLVFLRLTIALRKDHYDVLARAKIAELNDVFQAKLGWLKGNIYSRVATPDLEESVSDSAKVKEQFIKEYLPEDKLVWLSSLQPELIRTRVKEEAKRKKKELSEQEVIDIINKETKRDIEILSEKIAERLIKNKIITQSDMDKSVSIIGNVPELKTLINNR